jgi:hypothetical protein
LEELAHTTKRLEEKHATPTDILSLDVLRQEWEQLSLRVRELLEALQIGEYKLRQYAKYVLNGRGE